MKSNHEIRGRANTQRRCAVPVVSLLTLLCISLFASPARAGQTSTYVFLAGQSTITQTGGIAGIHRTYTITGTFQLTLDFEAGTATFDQVDANAVDDTPFRHTLDPNDVFNMTGLAGVIIDRTTIRFEGTADPSAPLRASFGSSVLITLTFADDTVTLKGQTMPPPNSADFFIFTLDVVAQRKYSGGTGEPNDPYQIATAADLIALGETPEDYSKHLILTADIDLDPNLPGRKVFDRAVIAPDANDITLWFDGTSFTGVFDGNGHTISHLTIIGGNYLGLFGRLGSWVGPAGEVRNLGMVDVNISGSGNDVGALVGCIGGYVPWNPDPSVANAGIVIECYAAGTVSGNSSIGGLVGRNGGRLANCYSTSTVRGDSSVGGLVGTNGVPRSVPGVAIPFIYGGCIFQCYSSGAVSGRDSVGGLVGANEIGFGMDSVTSSFWDAQTSGQTTSAGGTGKTTAEMQTAQTFLEAGWDFVGETANGTEDIWWLLEGKDYPRLSWQLPADDFEDGKPEPLWFVYEVDPDLVQIKEVNGRLETTASAEAQNVDAFYVADGWRLDATKGFAIQVDFHFSQQGGGDGRVTLGVVPSLDPSGMQWAELEAGCFESGPFYLYEVRDGSWVQEVVTERSSDGGTLYMSYDPDTDELYLSYTGYGKANNWRTVKGLLKGRWGSVPVSVILSGGSQGMALTGADAWLDNFAVSSGVLVLN